MTSNRKRKQLGYNDLENRCLLAADFGAAGFEATDFATNIHFTPEIAFQQLDASHEAAAIEWIDFGESDLPMGTAVELLSKDELLSVSGFSDTDGFASMIPNGLEAEFGGFVFDAMSANSIQFASEVGEADLFSPFEMDIDAILGSFAEIPMDPFGMVHYSETNFHQVSFTAFDSEFLDMLNGVDAVDGGDVVDGDPGDDHVVVEPVEGDFLDLSDGADGIFGSLDSENPSSVSNLFADGQVEIVLSTSLNAGTATIELRDANGELVEPTQSEDDGVFTRHAFDLEECGLYEVTVVGSDDVAGEFQLTATAIETPAVDQHADEIGSDATVLDLSSGFAELDGELETDGDVDVFQVEIAVDGEVVVFAGDQDDSSDTNLNLTVSDSEGEPIAVGSTNDSVQLTFDATEGETYYVSVQGDEGQVGNAYHLALIQESAIGLDGSEQGHVDEVEGEVDVVEIGSETETDADLVSTEPADAETIDELHEVDSSELETEEENETDEPVSEINEDEIDGDGTLVDESTGEELDACEVAENEIDESEVDEFEVHDIEDANLELDGLESDDHFIADAIADSEDALLGGLTIAGESSSHSEFEFVLNWFGLDDAEAIELGDAVEGETIEEELSDVDDSLLTNDDEGVFVDEGPEEEGCPLEGIQDDIFGGSATDRAFAELAGFELDLVF